MEGVAHDPECAGQSLIEAMDNIVKVPTPETTFSAFERALRAEYQEGIRDMLNQSSATLWGLEKHDG